MAGQNVVTVNEQNFETEVLKSTQPVLVDFWAEWCGPCKQIAPLIDELATEYAGKAKIGKINVDENQGLAARFGIRGIPTLLLFNKGQVTEQMVGMRSKRDLKAKLDAVVGAA